MEAHPGGINHHLSVDVGSTETGKNGKRRRDEIEENKEGTRNDSSVTGLSQSLLGEQNTRECVYLSQA